MNWGFSGTGNQVTMWNRNKGNNSLPILDVLGEMATMLYMCCVCISMMLQTMIYCALLDQVGFTILWMGNAWGNICSIWIYSGRNCKRWWWEGNILQIKCLYWFNIFTLTIMLWQNHYYVAVFVQEMWMRSTPVCKLQGKVYSWILLVC